MPELRTIESNQVRNPFGIRVLDDIFGRILDRDREWMAKKVALPAGYSYFGGRVYGVVEQLLRENMKDPKEIVKIYNALVEHGRIAGVNDWQKENAEILVMNEIRRALLNESYGNDTYAKWFTTLAGIDMSRLLRDSRYGLGGVGSAC